MIDVFEHEKRITDNFFLVKFHELNAYFLIQVLPFRIWEVEDYDGRCDYAFEETVVSKEDYVYQGCDTPVPLFIVTNKCNLACDYCYADEGSYGCAETTMSIETIDGTFDLILDKYRDAIRKHSLKFLNVNAVCFGGEPLLNLKGVERILFNQDKVARILAEEFSNTEIKVLQHINTNGYGINQEAKGYILRNRDKMELVFSFDGINHDLHRRGVNGAPTAEKVIESIREFASQGLDISITCCVHPDEMGLFEENIKYITGLFGKEININFSFLRGSLHFRSFSREKKEYLYNGGEIREAARIITSYMRAGYNIYSKKFDNIQERAYPFRCPAIGKSELCVMPDGNFYPCHNFVDDKYVYGNVLEDKRLELKNRLFDSYVAVRDIYRLEGCRNCCMKSICLSSFDCPSHSLFDLHDICCKDDVICDFGRIVQYQLLLSTVMALRKL